MATTQTLVSERTLPDIFYEEPEPVEDGMLQEAPHNSVFQMLYRHYADRPDVFVSGGGAYIMYNLGDGHDRIAPDCYIAFGVDKARIRKMGNFWVWDVGKTPDFALEVASPSTAARDVGYKRDLYTRLGIAEYWRLDPSGGELYGQPLIGERLVDGVYEPYEVQISADGSVESHSELLDLRFRFYWGESDDDGEGEFDILDPETGMSIDAAVVAQARADEAEVRADIAEVRADMAETRADSEQEARLAAEARVDEEQARADAAEAEARALREELDRLRRRQSGQ